MAHSIVRTHSYVDSGKKWSPGVLLPKIELVEGEGERRTGKGGGTFYSTDP